MLDPESALHLEAQHNTRKKQQPSAASIAEQSGAQQAVQAAPVTLIQQPTPVGSGSATWWQCLAAAGAACSMR